MNLLFMMSGVPLNTKVRVFLLQEARVLRHLYQFFRQLYFENKIAKNKLIFTNKTKRDIILKEEFNEMLGKSFINILTDENKDGYENSRIDMAFLKENITDFTQKFYICGLPEFVVDISEALKSLGAKTDAVVFEK